MKKITPKVVYDRAASQDRVQQLEQAVREAAKALVVAQRALEKADAGQVWLNYPAKPEQTPLTQVGFAMRYVKRRAPDLVTY
jgi:hypothetical protein